MTLWPAVSILALIATPAAAEAGGSAAADAAATTPHEAAQPQQQRRSPDRARSGTAPCATCAAPATRPPMVEAPNRALMLIPASRRAAPGDWSEPWGALATGKATTLAITMAARRPPLPYP